MDELDEPVQILRCYLHETRSAHETMRFLQEGTHRLVLLVKVIDITI